VKLTYFIYFPWLLAEAALPLLNIGVFVTHKFFETKLIEAKETAINSESLGLYKCLS
jgi:hypothetical protein